MSDHRNSSSHSSSSSCKKVEVIDLTLDSSSDEEDDDEPPLKRACPSLSPTSSPVNKGWEFILNRISIVLTFKTQQMFSWNALKSVFVNELL